jgi:hypothetical protein
LDKERTLITKLTSTISDDLKRDLLRGRKNAQMSMALRFLADFQLLSLPDQAFREHQLPSYIRASFGKWFCGEGAPHNRFCNQIFFAKAALSIVQTADVMVKLHLEFFNPEQEGMPDSQPVGRISVHFDGALIRRRSWEIGNHSANWGT